MRYICVNSEGAVMLEPETVDECGLMQWLSERFDGKVVSLTFDTTNRHGINHKPTLWIQSEPPAPKDQDVTRKGQGNE